MLFASGAINRQGSVEAGTTVGDASPEARARRGSTEINLMHLDYLGDHFALIDMPGGTGFAADGLAALQSADMALVVIDPAPERAALAEPMLRRLDELGVPHAIFVNKIENARAGAIRDLIAELQPMSGEPLALRQIPVREGEHVTGYVDLAMERAAYRYRPGKEIGTNRNPRRTARARARGARPSARDAGRFRRRAARDLADGRNARSVTGHGRPRDRYGDGQGRAHVLLGSAALTGGGVHRLLELLRRKCPGPRSPRSGSASRTARAARVQDRQRRRHEPARARPRARCRIPRGATS
ncbi:hypothetical protein KRR38_00005 [Novosphingobium sp. G106]|uniref:GTP-binding protein n=1 Tax=Novosphingobium sp. G106 TaxID=2849500 RepID=UPI001C2D1F4B|nr:hypothetical protein [Novosphingobium sp. G106]